MTGRLLALTFGLSACIDARSYVDEVDVGDGGVVDQVGAAHDEDLDGIPDQLDNCPDRPNPDQADTAELESGGDPDGVGDACDPQKVANRIVIFEPFTTDLGSAWSVDGTGAWRSDGDALTIDRVPAGESALRFDRRIERNLRVELVIEIVQPEAGLAVSLAEPWDPVAGRGPGCIATADVVGEASRLEARVIRAGAPAPAPDAGVPGAALTAGSIRRLALTATGPTAKQCQLQGVSTTGSWYGGEPAQLRIGVAAGIVSLRSLVVYQVD